MGSLRLGEAAEKAKTSKVDIWRAIREGRLSAQRTDDGGFASTRPNSSASSKRKSNLPWNRTQRLQLRLWDKLKRA
jgi:hypothetical protein